MKKEWKKKVLVGAMVSLLFVSALGFTALSTESVKASNEASKKTVEQVSFEMIEGAGIRLKDDGNGLRFGVKAKASDYTALMSNVGVGNGYAYKDIKFGMLIAPAYYENYYVLNEDNVFGIEAKYDWAVGGKYDGQNGQNGSKVRIINLQASEMSVDTTKNVATYYGSIVDLKNGVNDEVNNLDLEFKGVGYLQYTLQNGEVDYLFLEGNDNVRSMVYVAQKAIAGENPEIVLSDAQKQKLNEYYISHVTDKSEVYTVEHHVGINGVYTLKESETISSATIDDLVAATPKTYSGYVFDEENELNVLSGKVYANGKLTLKVYYKEMEVSETNLGLVDKNTVPYIDLSGVGDNRALVYANGVSVDADISGDTLSTENLNGAYVLTAINGDVKTVTYFDVYDANENQPEWRNDLTLDGALLQPVVGDSLTKTSVSLATELPSGSTADKQYYKVTGADERYAFSLAPVHSKEYYERYSGYAYALSFDYYLQAESKDSSVTVKSAFTATPETVVWEESKVGVWHTVDIAIESLIENWEEGQLTVRDFNRLAVLDGVEYTGGVLAGASAVKESIAYFGNYSLKSNLSKVDTITIEEQLLDVSGKTTFDMASLIPEGDKEYYSRIVGMSDDGVTWTMKPVFGTANAITLDSENVDVETMPTGYYTVCANVSKDGNLYPLFQANVDFYNSEKPLEWNDMMSEYFVYEDTNGNVLTREHSIVNSAHGRTGAYIKMAVDGAFLTTLLPKHSKAYYEQIVPQTDSLFFDYYIENPTAKTGNLTTIYFAKKSATDYSGFRQQRKMNTWLEENVPIKNFILTYWDEGIVSEKATAAARNGIVGFQKYVAPDANNPELSAENMVAYLGNFRIMPSSLGNVTQAQTVLLDLGNTSSCKLNDLLNETQKGYTKYGTIEWSLSPAYGGEKTVVNGANNILQLANIEKRAYSAEAVLVRNGETLATLYKGMVDIYNSADPIVWNNILSLNDIWSRVQDSSWSYRDGELNLDGAEFAEIITLNEEGHTGNYYKLLTRTDAEGNPIGYTYGAYVLPMHSKEYYATYSDYTLSFEIYASLNRNAYVMGTGFNSFGVKQWKTFTLNVSDVLTTYWDYITGTKAAAGSNKQYCPMLCVYIVEGYDFYIGNFTFAKANV